jgi:ectoine hydroxylase-related dioxygenase (phytanoyl-CoA dioxygenase family)
LCSGFHQQLEAWLKEIPAGDDPRAVAARELRAIPIVRGAGDLIVWHQALPHGATPNLGRWPRVVQFLNMFPARHDVNARWL